MINKEAGIGMKKWFGNTITALLVGVLLTGCTVQFGFPNVEGESTEKKAPAIEIKIAKHYEDGVDLKVSLQNIKTAKGNWKVKYCGLEEVRDNAGSSVLVGFGYSDCPIDDNPKPDYSVYASFTGVIDGKQTTIDKLYELTPAELDKVPVEKVYPTAWDDARNLAKFGYLYDTQDVTFQDSKEKVIKRFGEPTTVQGHVLNYNELSLAFTFDEKQKLVSITFISDEYAPISKGIDEIDAEIGKPLETNKKGDTTYYTYQFNQRNIIVAWSNEKEEIKTVEVKDKGVN